MCESCDVNSINRREFLQHSMIYTAATAMAMPAMASAWSTGPSEKNKVPATVKVVFLYPPDEVVQAGRLEDAWASYNWYTWPGNQFQPEEKQGRYTEKIKSMASAMGITLDVETRAIYTSTEITNLISRVKSARPDALLIFNFWNTFSGWTFTITKECGVPCIVYHPVGSSHQLPPKNLLSAEGIYYIHSIDNWAEIQHALYAVRTRKMMAQSRLLRISEFTEQTALRDPGLEVDILGVPAQEYNDVFDGIRRDDQLVRDAMAFKKSAQQVTDVTDEFIIEGFRAHRAVQTLKERYQADAVTIKCLMLKERKPCISFSLHNSALMPCACEDFPDSAMTLMLGRWLFDRPGFQHNPDFDINRNLYFGAHCTCALHLHGQTEPPQKFRIRPFFHQLPRTAALDVQWTPDDPVLLAKYVPEQRLLSCWHGKVVESPATASAGGCATRVLVDIPGVDDICNVYVGPHPILYCAEPALAHRLKAFAKLYTFEFKGNS